MASDTLPKLLVENFKKYGASDKVAMRRKDRGIWKEYSWKDYYENVKYFSLGLISLGLKKDDRVAVIGENNPEWLWATFAVQAARGAILGIFPDSGVEEVKYIVDHSESVFVITEDQEQTDKLLNVKKTGSDIKGIIYWDAKGMHSYSDPSVMFFGDVIELGKKYEMKSPGLFEKNVEQGTPEDIGTICYTSGTSGAHQKGAMFPQHFLVALGDKWTAMDPWGAEDDYVSYLSPAWGTEWQLGMSSGLKSAAILCFTEKPETVQKDIREIGPKVVFFSSRMWESVNSTIQAKISDTYAVNRFLYNFFLSIGHKVYGIKSRKKKIGMFWNIMHKVAEKCLFMELRDKVGLRNVKWAYTAGGGISPGIIDFFHAIGVNLKNGYGSTELMMATMHRDGEIRPESSGFPIEGYDIKISDDGEVLVNPPKELVFGGYLKDPEKTKALYNADGYVATGDAGFFSEDGQLVIMDRVAYLMTLKNGKKFAPDFVENRLRYSQYIQDSMCVGGAGRDFITVVLIIDFHNVGNWAEKHHVSYTSHSDLSQKSQILKMVMEIVEDVNETLPEWARIKRYIILHKEFDADEGEITRTRKLKRAVMEKKYEKLIDAMCSDAEEVMAEVPIVYQDGRKGVSKMNLKIMTVK